MSTKIVLTSVIPTIIKMVCVRYLWPLACYIKKKIEYIDINTLMRSFLWKLDHFEATMEFSKCIKSRILEIYNWRYKKIFQIQYCQNLCTKIVSKKLVHIKFVKSTTQCQATEKKIQRSFCIFWNLPGWCFFLFVLDAKFLIFIRFMKF